MPRTKVPLYDVVKPWAHEDDWGVEVVSVPTLQRVLGWLDAGVAPELIIAHADHRFVDCTPACAPLVEDEG